jgi:hypothetical protein
VNQKKHKANCRFDKNEMSNAFEVNNVYPKFRQFVDFIVKEAIIAYNPVSSPFALNDERKLKETRGNYLSAKWFKMIASEIAMEIMNVEES